MVGIDKKIQDYFGFENLEKRPPVILVFPDSRFAKDLQHFVGTLYDTIYSLGDTEQIKDPIQTLKELKQIFPNFKNIVIYTVLLMAERIAYEVQNYFTNVSIIRKGSINKLEEVKQNGSER